MRNKNVKFKDIMYEERCKRGLSVKDFALHIGFSYDRIRRWESGQSRPYVKDVEPLAKALGIPVEKLVQSMNNQGGSEYKVHVETKVNKTLNDYLDKHEIKRSTFADEFGVGRSVATLWLNGSMAICPEYIPRLANYMHISPIDFASTCVESFDYLDQITALGYIIRIVRYALGLSLDDLEKVFDATSSTIFQWESSIRDLTQKSIDTLEENLGLQWYTIVAHSYTTEYDKRELLPDILTAYETLKGKLESMSQHA